MKFVKTLFLAALVLGSVAPAFANDEFTAGDDGIATMSPDSLRDHRDNRDHRDDWRRPRPMLHVCFARNAIGRTFSARGWDIRMTQNQAVRACRARSFGPLGFTCRPAGCR